MRKKRRLWRLSVVSLGFLLLISAGLAEYGAVVVEKGFYARAAADLEVRAALVMQQVIGEMGSRKTSDLDALCKKLGKSSSTRITLILPSGKVVGDSEDDPSRMDNHADRPEVKSALAGLTGAARRSTHKEGVDMIFAAVPVKKEGEVVGVARAGIPAAAVEKTLEKIKTGIALGWLVLAAALAGASLWISRRIGSSLKTIKEGAERFSRGDLDRKISVADYAEIGYFAEALNQMSSQWAEKLKSILAQRSQQEAVLSSMMEGVLAVDTEENLISMNQAAAKLFNIEPEQAQGRNIQEVVRNTLLRKFVSRALSSQEVAEEDIAVRAGQGERILQVRGTVLRDASDKGFGALIVLNDVTRLRRLENIRRDFVANVSHELKTPITSIKGWVETLLDGAMDDPAQARQFLEIISRQAERLNAIIEDLLSLSRIEQEAETMAIVIEKGDIQEVIQAAIADCAAKADQKKLTVDMKCEGDMRANINQPLLEQALVNLIDNAIKYSEPGKSIFVRAARSRNEVTIGVRDEGCGIPEDHLPRLFERFYRVDKARSRKLGGTGLGLAIVKHIAQAHGGSVSVESKPQKGSAFFIHIPV